MNKEEKYELKVDIISLDILEQEDAFFYDLGADVKMVYGHFDYGGEKDYKGERIPDIRYFMVPTQAFLDECQNERCFLYYDLRKGTIDYPHGPDDYKTSSIGEWLEWFFEDGDRETVQKVTKAAVKGDLENHKLRFDAKWKEHIDRLQTESALEEQTRRLDAEEEQMKKEQAAKEAEEQGKRDRAFERFAEATAAFNRSQRNP